MRYTSFPHSERIRRGFVIPRESVRTTGQRKEDIFRSGRVTRHCISQHEKNQKVAPEETGGGTKILSL